MNKEHPSGEQRYQARGRESKAHPANVAAKSGGILPPYAGYGNDRHCPHCDPRRECEGRLDH